MPKLATKLSAPGIRPVVVERPHLYEQLNRCIEHKVLSVILAEFLPATGSPEVETALTRYIENWLAGRMLDEAGERAAVLSHWQSMLKAFKYLFWRRQRSDDVLRYSLEVCNL